MTTNQEPDPHIMSHADYWVNIKASEYTLYNNPDQCGDRAERAMKERAALAVNVARLISKVAVLERRERWFTEEIAFLREELEREKITPIPMPIGQVLEEARASNNTGKITAAEVSLDKLTWPVFDHDPRLQFAGGHYVIENIIDDVIKGNPRIDRHEIAVDFEDLIRSALRWCDSRSRWWANTRCWVEPVGEYLIIKRNRFAFQVKEPPSRAITEI